MSIICDSLNIKHLTLKNVQPAQYLGIIDQMGEIGASTGKYLHFHCKSLNEPLHLRCGSFKY